MTIINMVGGGGSPIPGLEGEYAVTIPTALPWGAVKVGHSGSGYVSHDRYITNSPSINLIGGSIETMTITAPLKVSKQHAQYTHNVSPAEYSDPVNTEVYFNGTYVYSKTDLNIDNISKYINNNSKGTLKCTLYSYKGTLSSPRAHELGVRTASSSSAGNSSSYTTVTSFTLPFTKSGKTISYSFNVASPSLRYTVLNGRYEAGSRADEYAVIVVNEINYA